MSTAAEAKSELEDLIARAVHTAREEAGHEDDAPPMVTEFLVMYKFISSTGRSQIGWMHGDQARFWDIYGLMDYVRAEIEFRQEAQHFAPDDYEDEDEDTDDYDE